MNKRKKINNNQTSFFFEDYLETNKKKFSQKKNNSQDRIYILFFLFFSLIFIFSIRIIHVSLSNIEIFSNNKSSKLFSSQRRDIIDRNGELLSRNIRSYHAAVNPNLIKNKDNFIIKIRLNFPNYQLSEENIKKGKYFYLKKELINQKKKNAEPR